MSGRVRERERHPSIKASCLLSGATTKLSHFHTHTHTITHLFSLPVRDGTFFVADGYCSNRIVKYAKDGTYLMERPVSVLAGVRGREEGVKCRGGEGEGERKRSVRLQEEDGRIHLVPFLLNVSFLSYA